MITQDNKLTGTCKAAPISDALHNKLLGAMLSAKVEVNRDAEVEAALRRLAPAPLSAPQQARLDVALIDAKVMPQTYSRKPAYARFGLWQKAAALVVLFCVCVGFIIQHFELNLNPDASNSPAFGLASRRVFNAKPVREIKWDGVQSRGEYEVLYEDSFVYSGDDDVTIIVTVPNRTTVSMEVTSI